ncbi:MAG: 30S ribosomal protein S7 [Saprospiraceae bacterium]|jgi:small subunit ribosomal protein S7|uniref:Small ribosomal subunit protein uS7 n=1 Tax=Candidatus Defluviibacterium haderslevense TaxID=2981993 RepID=A0A9D7XEZ7_9BACT|nr:30S ribosomal protein S7 [Candidatus Defluviibacterium haderslevense]MCC7026011.1 30S ribosomal protein S7 [Saprospiraceae bacterium]MBK7244768.1 30S ribosomal protein S7 [Candidatus Defluviibacterium haderslevense]MBK8244478.1 30S ribosomal protein S7 [Candidatus Defluviibacterium haderslevense]MBK9719664.1 30S ribosomal protein S7 [Candidatus Defluviibacterium haderslevense]
MRKSKPKKRILQPDPRFGDVLVTQFVNNLLWQGKKSTAYNIFYDAMDQVEAKMSENPHEVWKKAIANVMPHIEVRPKRIGGATFQIPQEMRPARKLSIGIKWLIKYSRSRAGKGMAEKLASEVIAASKNEGAAVKKKEDTHKMAESNRAFAHFRA